MNKLEQQVWAAAFAAEFSKNYHEYPHRNTVISSSCAKAADKAVEALREELTRYSCNMPTKEGYKE